MVFVDMNSDEIITLQDMKNDYIRFKKEDSGNHADDFKTEVFEILMATINGRNDLEIIGLTPHEISTYTCKLRNKVMK